MSGEDLKHPGPPLCPGPDLKSGVCAESAIFLNPERAPKRLGHNRGTQKNIPPTSPAAPIWANQQGLADLSRRDPHPYNRQAAAIIGVGDSLRFGVVAVDIAIVRSFDVRSVHRETHAYKSAVKQTKLIDISPLITI